MYFFENEKFCSLKVKMNKYTSFVFKTALNRYECIDGFELAGNHSGYAYCSNGTAMNVPSCEFYDF